MNQRAITDQYEAMWSELKEHVKLHVDVTAQIPEQYQNYIELQGILEAMAYIERRNSRPSTEAVE